MDRNQMKNTAQGLANELGGKVKKNVGKVIGDPEMEAEGAATELQGHAQRAANESTGGEGLAAEITPGLPVVCSQDAQFGVVDHVDGSELKLKKDANGLHHFIPLSWVTRVDSEVHVDRPGSMAMQEWRAEQ